MSSSKKILKNILSLSLAEFANKGIVFITTAYLAIAIKPEGFGILNFANAVVSYFAIIINLGFNTVGTRAISRSDEPLPKIVNSIISIRAILGVIALVLFLTTIAFIDKPDSYKMVLLIAGVNLVSIIFSLDWVYQGLERMEVVGIRQVLTSSLNLLGVFILVHDINDVWIAISVTSASTLLNAIMMLFYYIRNHGLVKFHFDKVLWKKFFMASLPISFSMVFLTVLSNFNTLMINLLVPNSDAQVGYFNAAYKLVILAIIPSTIIQGAYFPSLSRAENQDERNRVAGRYVLLNAVLGCFITIMMFTFSDFVINTVYKSDYAYSSLLLKVLMISTFMVYMNMSANHPLLAWNKEKAVMYATIIAGSVNIGVNLLLIPHFAAYGAAVTNIFSETTLCIGMVYLYYKSINKQFITTYLKIGAMMVVAATTGYWGGRFAGHDIIGIIIASIIYIGFIFGMKIINLNELKGIVKR